MSQKAGTKTAKRGRHCTNQPTTHNPTTITYETNLMHFSKHHRQQAMHLNKNLIAILDCCAFFDFLSRYASTARRN